MTVLEARCSWRPPVTFFDVNVQSFVREIRGLL